MCHTHLEEASLYEKERLIIEKTMKLTMIDLDSPNVNSRREKAMRLQLHNLLVEWVFFLAEAIKTLLLLSVLLYYNLLILAIMIIIITLLQLTINKHTATKIEKINQNQISFKRLMNYLFGLLVDRENLQEMKILKADLYLKNKLNNAFNKNYKEMQKSIFSTELLKAFLKLLYAVINISVIIVLILTADIKSAGQFILLYQVIDNLFILLPSLSSHYENLLKLIIQYEDFSTYLNRKEETLFTSPINYNNKAIEIQIHNLSFIYETSNYKALNRVNLKIKPGEKVAFVGDNGSGKSTLVKLIMGLYTASKGSIKWFIDNKELSYYEVGNRTRVVFQDYTKLHRSIRENVALGDISKLHNDKELFLALDKADGRDFSKNLSALIGPEFGGSDISGGQWQRLAISRAFLNEGSLLIYDEATSALDPESELKTFNVFLALAQGKTSIIVTHRLSMTKFVDKIAVIEKGSIVEYGSQEELLKYDSKYAKMYHAQSLLYHM